MVPLHPSDCTPQLMPLLASSSAHVLGVQVGAPQTLGLPPPPQVSVPVHVPQSSVPPQPLDWTPQL
jgi:hypothetical protein